ncbi:MAG TPA: hypothetical protein VN911_10910 [Candidatus Acidoferrum sp.]|nr:hypothetical protein [Candidatus Acidoferrum sp.]
MISRMALAVSIIFLLAAMCPVSAPAWAQSSTPETLPLPIELVRTTVANEVAAANDGSVKHMFRDYKKYAQGSQTRIYVETREAMAGMTIAYNDNPLTPQQLQSEEGRLSGLVNNPQQLERKRRQEKEETDHTLAIVKALPDAFIFSYDGTEAGTARLGRDGVQLMRLRFRPNPTYRPPSHVEDVLVGMSGFLLIDPEAHRIARINGTLFKEVTFGWGILGHLDRGGHFLVEQQGLPEGSWEISRMSLNFNGKILLFKTIAIKSEEVFSDFQRVPASLSFAEGVQMLKAERAKLAAGHTEAVRAQNNRINN